MKEKLYPLLGVVILLVSTLIALYTVKQQQTTTSNAAFYMLDSSGRISTNTSEIQHDTCNLVDIKLAESAICPRISTSSVGTQVDNYTNTISLSSLDGKSHEVTYYKEADFCLQGSKANPSICKDNPQISTSSVITIPATGSANITLQSTKPAVYANQMCGTYQQDFSILSVDGKKDSRGFPACTYQRPISDRLRLKGRIEVGSVGYCETGTTCKAPACGVSCSKDSACAGAKNGCTSCVNNVCSSAQACGAKCTQTADCAGAKDGCTACTGGVCKAPACGVSCSKDSECAGAKDGCSACVSGVCKAPSACSCDGIQNTDLSIGSNATITSFAKVSGADLSKKKITNQQLFLAEGDETTGTIISNSGKLPANIVSSSSSLVRYQSEWNLTMPQLKKGSTYRLWSQLDCQPSTAASTTAMTTSDLTRVVLAAQTNSFWDMILRFFSSLFAPTVTNTSISTTPVPTISSGDNKNLQLQTLNPGKATTTLATPSSIVILDKTCTFIKFKVQ